MQNYMHNIAARMSKPLRIRIGGNGMDGYDAFSINFISSLPLSCSSTYIPDLKDVIEHVDEDAYFNDIPVNFGPRFFDILNGMHDKVGAMQFTIGLSMRNGHDFSNVTKLGKAARDKLGNRLDSLFLGNVGPFHR